MQKLRGWIRHEQPINYHPNVVCDLKHLRNLRLLKNILYIFNHKNLKRDISSETI